MILRSSTQFQKTHSSRMLRSSPASHSLWCKRGAKASRKHWEPLSTRSLKSLSVKSLLRLKTRTISSQRTKAVSLPLSLGYRLVLSTRWELSPLDPRWHRPQSWQPDVQIDLVLRRLLLKQPICRRCVYSWEVLPPLFSISCQQWRKHCHCGYRVLCILWLFSALLPIMMWLTLEASFFLVTFDFVSSVCSLHQVAHFVENSTQEAICSAK